jgi:hypothetical protein
MMFIFRRQADAEKLSVQISVYPCPTSKLKLVFIHFIPFKGHRFSQMHTDLKSYKINRLWREHNRTEIFKPLKFFSRRQADLNDLSVYIRVYPCPILTNKTESIPNFLGFSFLPEDRKQVCPAPAAQSAFPSRCRPGLRLPELRGAPPSR